MGETAPPRSDRAGGGLRGQKKGEPPPWGLSVPSRVEFAASGVHLFSGLSGLCYLSVSVWGGGGVC